MKSSNRIPFIKLSIALSIAILIGCKSSPKTSFEEPTTGEPTKVVVYNNPPAEGFDVDGSSVHAIVMADQVMLAMGGRENWDKTEVIFWNFLGKRTLLWDKNGGKVRIDDPSQNLIAVLNIDDESGKAWIKNEQVNDDAQLKDIMKWAKETWINDSYWLFMPFKLKDTGVTLKYEREDSTITGKRSDVLRLTFSETGITPNNAYEVWVDYDTRLIEQWAFYKNKDQELPTFVLPWTNYQQYGDILLASERGDRDITDIKVLKKAPKGAFDDPDPLRF